MKTKRRKFTKDVSCLCEDEVINILLFLSPNEIVTLSLLNKHFFFYILNIAKTKAPKIIHEPWNIKEAFGNSKMCKFKYSGLFQEDSKIFIEKLDLIQELYTGYYQQGIQDLLSTVEKKEQIELVHLQISENKLEQKKITKKIEKTYGHRLKKLILHFPNDLEVYQILQFVPFLQDLSVILRPEPFNQENYEIQVPILEKLEKLEFYHCSQYDESFFTSFLSLCPNLKTFKISTERLKMDEPVMQTLLDFKPSKNIESISDDDDFFNEKFDPIGTLFTNVLSEEPVGNLIHNLPLNDYLLNYLLNFKKLRVINIESNRDFVYLRSDIKDESLANIINNLPMLEELVIRDKLHVSGEFFNLLKENKTLKELDIHREVDEIVDSLMNHDYYFRFKFSKLKSLKLYGFNHLKFWLSLFINCIQLESITNYMKSSEMEPFFEILKNQDKLKELKKLRLYWDEKDKIQLEKLRRDIELLHINDLD